MKAIINSIIFMVTLSNVFAQTTLPVYEPKPVNIIIPISLPGLSKNKNEIKNGNITYKLKGQIYENSFLPSIENGFKGEIVDRKNPWGLVSMVLYGFQTGNLNSIVPYYEEKDRAFVQSKYNEMSTPESLSKLAEIKNVKAIAAFEHNNGVVAFVEIPGIGIEANYISYDGTKYSLAVLGNDSLAWNLSLYFHYKPEPFKAPKIINYIDSIANDSTTIPITLKLSKPGNYIYIIPADSLYSSTVLFMPKDNDNAWDLDNREAIIQLDMPFASFFGKGKHEYYLVEGNYPVNISSADMIKAATRMKILIK